MLVVKTGYLKLVYEANIQLRARLDCLTKPSDISHLTKSGPPKLQNSAIFAKYHIWNTDQ